MPFEEILQLIPHRSIGRAELDHIGRSPEETVRELIGLSSMGGEALQLAVLHVLLRAFETYILADDKLLNIARFKDLFLGTADDLISQRLSEMFHITPTREVVAYLRHCLTSRAASDPSGEKRDIVVPVGQRVLQDAVEQHPRRELRCVVCGYHFLEEDAGSRVDFLRDCETVFAQTREPGRLEDLFKPRSYTQLELDHIVPEEGFGWSDPDNLQVTCKFCNFGRMIFRRSLEPLSTMIAGSLGFHPPSRPHRPPRQIVIVARLLEGNGTCSVCGAHRTDTELTVQLRDPTVQSRVWFVPWNLETVCYRCRRVGGGI